MISQPLSILGLGLALLCCKLDPKPGAAACAPTLQTTVPQQETKHLRLELASVTPTQPAAGPWKIDVTIANEGQNPLAVLEPLIPEGRSLWFTLLDAQNLPVYSTPRVKGERYPASEPCLLPAGHRLSASLAIEPELEGLQPGTYKLQVTYQPRGQAGVLRSSFLEIELTESK